MSEQARPKLISVITPCFNEEDNLEHCHESVRRVFQDHLPGYEREHLFCDNASTDGSEAILRRLAAKDPHVRVILNSRNFGPLPSTFNALMQARGDAVLVLLAADLQDPPELLPEMAARWEQGHQVVYGVRKTRSEGLVMRAARKVYYRMVKVFSNIDIPMDVGSFQLVDRRVVEALRGFGDHFPHIPNMIASCGFKSVGIPYDWRAREHGTAKNKLHHLFGEALNSLISFSNAPMRICLVAGFVLAVLSILRSLYTIVATLILHGTLVQPGIPTLISALFFFAGVQLFFLGVIGEYIGSIHTQVRSRPLVIERERINFEDEPPSRD